MTRSLPIALLAATLALAGCAERMRTLPPAAQVPAAQVPAVVAQVPVARVPAPRAPAPLQGPATTLPFVEASVPAGGASCSARPDPAFETRVPTGRMDRALLDRAILFHTNRARCRFGLEPLSADPTLRVAATGHSADMVRVGFFGHTSPVPGRTTMGDRLEAGGVRFRAAGENLATAMRLDIESAQPVYPLGGRCDYSLTPEGTRIPARTYDSLAEHLVVRWMESPGHRKNLLSADFSRHGASGVLDPWGRLCDMVSATQLFAG